MRQTAAREQARRGEAARHEAAEAKKLRQAREQQYAQVARAKHDAALALRTRVKKLSLEQQRTRKRVVDEQEHRQKLRDRYVEQLKKRTSEAKKADTAEVYAQRFAAGDEWKDMVDDWLASPLARLHQSARWAIDGFKQSMWRPGEQSSSPTCGHDVPHYRAGGVTMSTKHASPGYTYYGSSFAQGRR